MLTRPSAEVAVGILTRNGVLWARRDFFYARALQTQAFALGRWGGFINFADYWGLVQDTVLNVDRYGAPAGLAVLNVTNVRDLT